MKVSREYLKEIVKECLIEILNDGIGNLGARQSSSQRLPMMGVRQPRVGGVSESVQRQKQQRSSALDQPAIQRNLVNAAVKQSSGGNSILESILADTARTTLPGMMNENSHAMPPSNDPYVNAVAQADPEELFGDEAASKWAALAFAEPINKK